MTLRAFKCPFAVCQRLVFVRIIWAFYNISTAGHVVMATGRTIQFVRPIATVILVVTSKLRIDALTIWTVVRPCKQRIQIWHYSAVKNTLSVLGLIQTMHRISVPSPFHLHSSEWSVFIMSIRFSHLPEQHVIGGDISKFTLSESKR
jgi:hypothetical protein